MRSGTLQHSRKRASAIGNRAAAAKQIANHSSQNTASLPSGLTVGHPISHKAFPMSSVEQNRFTKKRLVPVVIYTAVLCLSAQLYIFLSRYELFMQVLDTLLPLFALVSLLVLSIACALLLIARTPLWLLLPCHVLVACWWLLSFYFQTPTDQRGIHSLWSGYNLGFLVGCLSPPLLGWALLTFRWRQLQKAKTMQEDASQLSFESTTDILTDTDATHSTDSKTTHE